MAYWKFKKVSGYWVYCHITPNGMFYIGMSGYRRCCDRWRPSMYKNNSLEPYIKQYGWDNIQHIVLKDGLTKEQALQLEDLLIQEARKGGWCINDYRSGGVFKDNQSNWYKERYKREREKRLEYAKRYQQNKGKYGKL